MKSVDEYKPMLREDDIVMLTYLSLASLTTSHISSKIHRIFF